MGKDEVPKRYDFIPMRNMLLKAIFYVRSRGYVRSNQKGAGHPSGALYFHERQEHAIISTLHNLLPTLRMASPSLWSTKTLRAAPAKNRLCQLSAWQTPPNCWRFHDNLYQIQFSGCSAFTRISTAISAPPLQPTQSPYLFQN